MRADKNRRFVLENGVEIPCVAFGTYKIRESCVEDAICAGYRYFDTASKYGTEPLVGEGILKSGIGREQFFLATKVWKTEMGYDNTLRAFDESLEGKGAKRPDRKLLIIRLMAGGYLIYLAVNLLREKGGGEGVVYLAGPAVFLAAGVLIGGWALVKLIRGSMSGKRDKDW